MKNPIEINDLATVGAVRDTPPYMLLPEAFTLALNMRIVDGGLERLLGWEQVFGTLPVQPHFLMPVQTASETLWLYTSLEKAYAYSGGSHTEITRAVGGDYGTSSTEQWNGTLLANIPVINNGVDVPQYWAPVEAGQKLQDLGNWPSGVRAKIIRAYGPFLVAFNVTKPLASYPHMVKWSHSAEPGTIPDSWDETDPTKDTGEIDLPDVKSGLIRDALPLSDTMFVYKDASTWKMRFVGGRFIFDFGQSAWLPNSGILAPRCVAITGDGTKHVVATQDDIIWHDGNKVRSILNERQRRRLFNEIDTENFHTSFMFDNPFFNEMWFCYPTSGMSFPNRALVMNYARGEVWPITEVDGITFRNAAVGQIEGASDEEWDPPSDPDHIWDFDDGPWSELARRRVILVGTEASKFYDMDSGTTRDGTVFVGTLQREGISVLGKKRNGDWIVDFDVRKLGDLIWPRAQGGPITIRMGAQETVDGPVTWGGLVPFDPASEVFAYVGPIEGRALALEFSASTGWRLDGYKFEVDALGTF